jgi:hypothetical protein
VTVYNDTHCQFAAGRTATLRLILFALLILTLPTLAIAALARLRLHSRRVGG